MDKWHNEEHWKDWVNLWVDGLVGPCARCGRDPVILDYGVDDEFWETVVPEKWKRKVLCLECLCALDRRALSRVFNIYITIGGRTVLFVPAWQIMRDG